MTAIIAYGTVVRSPILLGLPLPHEERSVVFCVVVERDFTDDDGTSHKRGLYRVILSGEHARYAEIHLKEGASVLVRGELFSDYPLVGDPLWNHRLVFGDEISLLAGALPSGRAYPVRAAS